MQTIKRKLVDDIKILPQDKFLGKHHNLKTSKNIVLRRLAQVGSRAEEFFTRKISVLSQNNIFAGFVKLINNKKFFLVKPRFQIILNQCRLKILTVN